MKDVSIEKSVVPSDSVKMETDKVSNEVVSNLFNENEVSSTSKSKSVVVKKEDNWWQWTRIIGQGEGSHLEYPQCSNDPPNKKKGKILKNVIFWSFFGKNGKFRGIEDDWDKFDPPKPPLTPPLPTKSSTEPIFGLILNQKWPARKSG